MTWLPDLADHLAAVSLWRAAKVREFQHRLQSLGLLHDAAAACLLQRLQEANDAVQRQQEQQAKQQNAAQLNSAAEEAARLEAAARQEGEARCATVQARFSYQCKKAECITRGTLAPVPL